MVNFSVNFIETAIDYGYWELYSNDTRIGTFSVCEIAGLHIKNPVATKLICSSKFGEIIIGTACGLRVLSEGISQKMLPFLKKVVQTQVEITDTL
jgi:hypothetical protein